MPTLRDRTYLTHTPTIQEALDLAETVFVADAGNSRALISDILTDWTARVRRDDDNDDVANRESLLATKGAFTGLFGSDYLEVERAGWSQ